MPTVVVAFATFRRPAGLARLVPALQEQVAALSGASARIVAVDNDPDGGARQSLAGLPGVHYEHEPEPGIAAARNRALELARDDDAIVFIDDDEVPEPQWLQLLVDGWLRWRCAAVTGPVISVPDQPLDDWLRGTGLFTSQDYPTGSLRPGAWTSNLLLDVTALAGLGLRFDDSYGLSGGSDTRLTHAMVAAGLEIRWCQEAQVSEAVPAARTTREWAVSRTVRTANGWGRSRLQLTRSRGQRARCRAELLARGSVKLARGALGRVRARARGDVAADGAAAIELARGIGVLKAATGTVVSEYLR